MALNEAVRSRIADLVARHRVVLFMKGTRTAPQCGFSAQVVQILDELLPAYETVDALASPELREGIKEFSQWPTIPQLYVEGKFVGGCDIVREMSASGELQRLLGPGRAPAGVPPVIEVTEAAARAFEAALAGSPGDWLRLTIGPSFQHDLFLGAREPGDVEAHAKGLTLLLDPSTVRRASGLGIDYVTGPTGGFKLTNPNEPPKVKPLAPAELKAMLDRGEVVLFDVRPESERAIASIAGARALDGAGQDDLRRLPRETPIAFHCHHGVRSQQAAVQALGEGFRKVFNLSGGIDEWSRTVDSTVPRY
ncbi:MAG: Grx4 family monothiol glutaredoxin [Myxococcota bacterium]|nr:Grx4 family monothiol glutaredoxin [Myxococcota bacterium]